LINLENIILEYLCSDDFEQRSNNPHLAPEQMRVFEFKLSAYFEVYKKTVEIVEEKPDDEGQDQKKINDNKYQCQKDFLTVVQNKICFVLSKQRPEYLAKQGFVMNS